MTVSMRAPAICILAGVIASAGHVAMSAEEPSLKPGLPWVQFHSPDFTRPAESGVDRQINLDTGRTIDGYSRVWMGLLKPPVSGQVSLAAEADDGVELWIADDLIIDGWGPDRAREGEHLVQAGQLLPLEVRFYQNGGTAHLRLFWRRQGQPRELIPPAAFWHRDADAKRVDQMMKGKAKAHSRTQNKGQIYNPSAGHKRPTAEPIRLRPGPHLLIDDHLIEQSTHVQRKVNRPERRLRSPVVTGKKGGDNCFQPYLEVIRDVKTGRFRIWYGVPESASQSHVAHMESEDGINWVRPHRVLKDPSRIQFGVSVIDEGPDFADPSRRFKFGYYGEGGLRVAASPDGQDFKPIVPRTVLRHNHDINNIWRDPLRDRYLAMVSSYIPGERWSGLRRCPMLSVSKDLVRWRRPWLIVTPDDDVDKGQTQFYGVCAFLARGDLLIGMVKVLRDDLPADPGNQPTGIGYTTLAWSRDGEHWTRDRTVFFDRHPKKGTWDHAMGWIDCQVPVDDEVYLYYGGYAQGHKINRFEERQIGLVRMARDRYVGRQADDGRGLLRTPPVILEGNAITLNVDAAGGEVRVQVLGVDGRPIEGLAFADCEPIKIDALRAPVRWRGRLDAVSRTPVRLEFSLNRATLFAFEVGK